jgi:hypothetical protein
LVQLTAAAGIVTGVGQCVMDGLTDFSLRGTPAGFRACLLLPTNQIAWDNCGCPTGGQFAQAITSRAGSSRFPAADTGNWSNCGPPLDVVNVMTSISRCVPTMDQTGTPPTCEESMAAAIGMESDRDVIRQALACCLGALKHARLIQAWNIGPSATLGELGGCVAIETPYAFALASCLCSG